MCIRYVANSPGDLRTGGASRATPHPALRALEPLASRARSTRRNTPHPAPDNAHNQTAPSGQNEQTCSGWAGGKEHVQSSHASARHSSRARLALRSEARHHARRRVTHSSVDSHSVSHAAPQIPKPKIRAPRPSRAASPASVSSTPPPITLTYGPCRVPRHAISVRMPSRRRSVRGTHVYKICSK